MAAPLSYYLDSYPELSHTDLARLMIKEGNPFSERTLRRSISESRSADPVTPKPRVTPPTVTTDYNKYYHYQPDADSYLLFLPGEKPFCLSGETVRSLKRAYSDWDGQPATINEVCRRFTLSRKIFTKLKNALGWSHDAEPFTDEEVLSRSEDELTADLLQTRKFSLEQKYQAVKLKELARDAQAWREFNHNFFLPFEASMEEYGTKRHRPKAFTKSGYEPYVCVLAPFDLHFGKYGWIEETGTQYNRQVARHLLLTHTDELLADLANYPLDRFVVPVGSDFFHIDTDKGETTSGTRQDTDGSAVQIYAEGCQLMIEFIERLSTVAPVEIKLTAGNHDRLLSHALLIYLQGYYRQSDTVTVIVAHQPRQYVQWGNTMIGFTHGDGVKPDELPLLMMSESRAEGVIQNRVWFTGHYHHSKLTDLKGTLLIQMPSLSGADRWHARNGYVGSVRGLCAYLLCKQRGLRLTLHSSL